jgi:ferric-dicitrate binding protein FerR (iron transport regulator)
MTGRIDDGGPDALRDEAVAWLVRVQSDAATADDWAALGRWLDGSEARQAAFDEVEQLSQEIESVSPPRCCRSGGRRYPAAPGRSGEPPPRRLRPS